MHSDFHELYEDWQMMFIAQKSKCIHIVQKILMLVTPWQVLMLQIVTMKEI